MSRSLQQYKKQLPNNEGMDKREVGMVNSIRLRFYFKEFSKTPYAYCGLEHTASVYVRLLLILIPVRANVIKLRKRR